MSTTDSTTTTAVTYAASGSAVIFGLSANEFAAVAGVCIALLTFALNWYYKRQHLALARARYERLREQEEATEVDDV